MNYVNLKKVNFRLTFGLNGTGHGMKSQPL